MRLKLLPVLLLLAVAPLPGRAEDLMDAYRQAVANDPVLATADAQRLMVAEGVPIARSALLPQLSAGLQLNQIHSGGNGQTTNSSGNIISTAGGGHTRDRNFTGNLSQSIIDLSAIANLRAAHAADDAQEQTYQAALQNLYVRVANAYFNVLVSEDMVGINRAYEDAYKQEYDQTSTRFKNGLSMAADVSQSKALYLYIKAQRIGAEDSLKDARRALQQITGKPVGTLLKLRDDLPTEAPQPNDEKAWVDAALKTNPAVLAARYAVSSDEHKVSAARAGHLPTLTAGVGYNKFGQWSNTAPGTGAYGPATTTVGLTLTVPLFSGGLTHARVKQALYQRDADEGVLESQRRQAARDAANYFNLVQDGIEQVASARDSVEAAEKTVTSMRAGYSIGTQSLTSVVIAIQYLANMQSEYTVVRHQFILNKLLLKQAAGTIDMSDLQAVNGLLK
ncbi:MAG: type I secretion protein TolC [Rhodanobacter sp. 68-29]|uniref:TolC family outer membrane protein n=1 Tax=Rhodanobacter sp. PCA2 TaxID=2006117 RepID=UPI00086A10D8|nr:TolC family outer membrane protein [Rhodanobacter sp. PCA2]MBA2077605.1 type I secretion protein TolC [Rhodanobacter sp. PCA2]MBN8922559.1 TolC family outer membrane protein [Rhodanobacter sp.]ODU76135.1 MAG: type I secretion protein TolC [Rhodanobacter sp. SCN 69-32]OJY62350.1 MAG: type I secretion protein TolC [Rhodanobacter sp. 68-29]